MLFAAFEPIFIIIPIEPNFLFATLLLILRSDEALTLEAILLATTLIPSEIPVESPHLWSAETPYLYNLVIETDTEIIGENAFVGCKKLINIVMPESVCEINDYAFAYCHNLRCAIIPDRVYMVNENIFKDCGDLIF